MKRNVRSIALAFCLMAVAVGVAAASPLNRKISGNLPDYADLHPYQNVTISPDGRYAVYASDARVDDFYELYSVPLDGSSAPVRISGPTQRPVNSSSLQWTITSDSRHVVYRNNESILTYSQLVSTPIAGGEQTLLAPEVQASSAVNEFVVSPDGTQVVMTTDRGLYSVPVTGGEGISLAGTQNSYYPEVAADGKTIVYVQSDPTDGTVGLFSVPIGGGPAVTLSEGLKDLSLQMFEDSGGVQRIAFFALHDDSERTFYTVAASGGELTPVVTALNLPVYRFEVCADGERVVYEAGSEAGNLTIASVSLTEQVPITLAVNTGMPNRSVGQFAVSPDCASVVYGAGDSLFVVPVEGGSPTRVSHLCLSRFSFSPDSRHMVYWGRDQLAQPCEVHTLDLETKSSARMNAPLPKGGRVQSWTILVTPDSQAVLYVAEQETSGVAELFRASFDGAEMTKLSGSMTFGGNVSGDLELSPDGRYVVYVADQERDEVHELFATSLRDEAGAWTYLPLVER